MRPLTLRLLAVSLLLVLAVPAFAVTYLVPTDREMIQRADGIVVATSVTSTVERTAQGGIVTRYILRIEDVLKGERSRGSYLRLTEIGGELGGMAFYASGMPVYVPGRQYLVFTDANAEGEPMTWGLELGQFTLQGDFALRNADGGIDQNNWEAYREGARDARGFMKYIRGIVGQKIDPEPTYFVPASFAPRLRENEVSAQSFSRSSYLVFSAPRWQGAPTASIRTALTATGANGVASANAAMNAWNATPATPSINYTYFGQDDTAINGFNHCGSTPCAPGDAYDSKNTILFNDPNGEVTPPVLGRGGYWSSGATYQLSGETFRAIDGGIDVVIDNISWQQCLLDVVVLHEMGHTFGLRHSNQNPDGSSPCNATQNDCTSNAVMNSSVGCSTTTLQTWDRTAIGVVYGAGPTCTPASISGQPQDKPITSGQPANVTVTAAGDSLTYQWFIGSSNTDTSNPIAGQTSAMLTHAPTQTTSYWVRVNGCNSSSAACRVVTVTVAACNPPSITSQPQGATIPSGNSTTLTVGVTGTSPFTYQWYIGTPQDTSSPTGTNSASLIVSPTATTSYWVRV